MWYYDTTIYFLLVVPVAAFIEFTQMPLSQAVVFGQNVVLNCEAVTDQPGTLTYTWYHNGTQLTASVFSNNSLLIVDVQQNKLGNYSCHVTSSNHSETNILSSAVLIQAYIRPFVTNPSQVTVTEGDTAILECVTGESAPPPQVYWEKDGQPVTSGSQFKARFGTQLYDMIGQYYMKLILDSKPRETGLYSCVAVNTAQGIQVKSLVVQVKISAIETKPYIDVDISQNSSVMAPESFQLVLNCAIGSFPKPVITWYKLQDVIVPDSRVRVLSNGSLEFVLLIQDDQGYYFCEGSNYLGHIRTQDVFVQVSYIDLLFQEEPESLYITAGHPVVLHCSPPTSFPLANVSWYKNNQPMKYRTGEQAVYIVDPVVGIWNLFFTDIQKQDEGRYFCVASNNYAIPTSRTSKSSDLQIGGGPVFVDPPVSTSVVTGEGTQMTCMVGGDPFPQITWFLNGLMVLPDDTLILRNQNQELHMANVNKIREGLYTCRATNIYGESESTAYLKVLVPPVIIDFTESVTVLSNHDLVLPCYVNGDPKPTIQWLKDGKDITSSDRILIGSSDLTVKKVDLTDAGIYTCHAFNMAGAIFNTATVIVNMKPEFLKSPLNKTVILGLSVAMDCEVRGHPTPTVSWLFNGTNLLPHGTIVSSDNHGIHVAMVTWRHVGLYTCVASNILEAVTRDGRLSVHVLPRIQAINGDPVVYLNQELDLTCTVSGIPNPTIKWVHQDTAVVPSLDGRVTIPAQNKLFIKYVKVSDQGEYKCVAENLAGKTEFPITVTVIESPIPPVLTRAVSFTSTTVTLRWSPSTQNPNTPLSQYIIYYKKEIDVDYKRLPITAGSTDSQIEVVGLSPGTMYMFVVSGVNPAGEGSLSNVLSAKTMDSGPSAPRNLKILFSNSSTMQLEWEIPAETNGQIRKYQVWYKIKGDNTEIMSLVTTKDISKPSVTLTINNLDPFTPYEFKVRGATEESGEDMWGELSGYIDVKTSASVPSDVPQITKVQTLSSTAIQVGWQDPPIKTWDGQSLKYRVYSTDLNFTSATNQITTTHFSINITTLSPWRWYSFVLEIGNEAGWGDRSNAVISNTFPSAPSAPPVIFSIQVSDKEVKVTFQLPDKSTWNSKLTGVIIQYTDGNSVETNYVDNIQKTSLTIRQLLPWTEYRLRLGIYTDTVTNGNGPYTEWRTVRTNESAPGKVGNVNYQATPTSITLTWSPPQKPNGVIQHYVIQYQDKGLDEDHLTSNVLVFRPTTEDTMSGNGVVTRIQTDLTTVILQNLSPGHVFRITIVAVNGASVGDQFYYTASTTFLPPLPIETTTKEEMSTEATTISLSQSKGVNSVLSPAVFGGIIAGAVLVVMVIILVTCLCIRRKRLDQAKYVNTKNPGVFGNLQGDKSLRTSKSEQLEDRGSLRRIDFVGDSVQYGSNNKTKKEQPSIVISSLEVPGTQLIKRSSNNSINGIENPGYKDQTGDTESLAVSMTLSSEDFLAESASLKRTSRMRTESAAAIAVLRNQRLPRLPRSQDDTDTLINHDSVVIYTERTAL
ncbi:cell adhesion molecule DSCAM-like [Mytilus trossulus]|uniref:cell adhesion molecule DSCAM-like n=1 Tax=Mytilus trossulus TaxID=6551 RepID=UPI003004A8EC